MPAYLALWRDGTINVISCPKNENFFDYVDHTGNVDDALYLPIKGKMTYEIRSFIKEAAAASMIKACVWDNLEGEPPPFLIYSDGHGLVRASDDDVRRFFGAFNEFWDESMLDRRTGEEKFNEKGEEVKPVNIIRLDEPPSSRN